MSTYGRDPSCEVIAQVLPELALGVLTGRDRAAALAHTDSCARCAEELEQLSRAADAVVLVAPDVEPPVGFEVRLFHHMGVSEKVVPIRRRPPTWALASAAAVVALLLGLAIGRSVGSPSNGKSQVAVSTPTAGPVATTAALRHDGESVGRVTISSGSRPWMYMNLNAMKVTGAVKCQVVTDDGVTHTVGAFTVTPGHDAWGAPLPVSSRDVRRAQVVSPTGTVIATAALVG